ncbi:LPXTG cell wall anchor domain-containing protein [Lacticaseibacillus camelliae]
MSPKEQAATGNLPKTGDNQSSSLALLGAAIISGLSMAFGFGDRRKRN